MYRIPDTTRQSKRRGEVAEWWWKGETSDGVIQVWDWRRTGKIKDLLSRGCATDFAAVENDGRDSLLFRLLVLGDNEVSNVQLPRLSNSRVGKGKKKKRSNMALAQAAQRRKAREVVGPGPSPQRDLSARLAGTKQGIEPSLSRRPMIKSVEASGFWSAGECSLSDADFV